MALSYEFYIKRRQEYIDAKQFGLAEALDSIYKTQHGSLTPPYAQKEEEVRSLLQKDPDDLTGREIYHMKTTNQIIPILENLRCKAIDFFSILHDDMLDGFRKLASQQPAIYPFFLKSLPSTAEVSAYFESITQHENDRMTMPDIPVAYFKENLQRYTIFIPVYLPWQTADNKAKNIIINYDTSSAERAVEIYRHMVMSILLGLPSKSVHLSFVNTQLSSLGNFFTANLHESLYEKVSSSSAYHQLLNRLLKRVMDFQDKYSHSIEQENEIAGKIVEPYEVVILLDDPDSEIAAQDQLIPLFEKGPLYGIYFIGLNNTEKGAQREEQDHILKHTGSYQTIDAGTVNPWSASQEGGFWSASQEAFITTLSIANNSVWAKAAFEHINAATTRQKVFKYDWQAAINAPYTQTDNEIVTPIGFTQDGTPFNFKMDQNNHAHAFLIGATGSGKSRFLHDVIISITAKYQPEDLQLYLLDFKGVEFNCYRGLKHARAILVDRADERITYEVIFDIKCQMEERQQLLGNAGVSDVKRYNRMNPDKRLPQILLIVDECQTLFTDRAKNGRLQNEMVDIITLIATQGRSNGVHLLLSTQSLANTPQLTSGILSQISEHYILPCRATDATKLVETQQQVQTEKVVATMEKGKGQCYYQGAEENDLFTFNYIAQGDMQNGLVDGICQKATSHQVNEEQAYFSGSIQLPISQEVADYIATKGRKSIVASPGQNISLEQTPLTISLKDDLSENIALFGINDRQFVTRTTLGLLSTLMISNKQKDLGYQFIVFDCLGDDEAEYLDVLDEMESKQLCEVVAPRKRVEKLKQLCDEIASGNPKPTILTILGQERFRELKLNQPITEQAQAPANDAMPAMGDIAATLAMMNNIGNSGTNNNAASTVENTQDALKYILNEGPSVGVHTILQVDKPNNFLFPGDGSFRKTDLYAKCKHVILMRSEDTALSTLWLQDDIRVAIPKLEDNPNRLRAYYYNEESDKYQLFTPFVLPDKDTINNIIK